jgi:hypothetical protein
VVGCDLAHRPQSSIKFFFTNVLKRKWHTFNYLNAKRERRLPCILSQDAAIAFKSMRVIV